jgi:hypothetical protein
LRFWKIAARGLIKPPDLLQPLVEKLKEDHGKAIHLDHEDKEGYSEPIEFLAGPVKATVYYMEVAEATLAKEREQVVQAPRQGEVAGLGPSRRSRLKREVVNRYWGEGQLHGVCCLGRLRRIDGVWGGPTCTLAHERRAQ